MPFEFGDIVLVPFPFTNQAAFKKRPAVVVSNPTYNRARPDIVVIALGIGAGMTIASAILLQTMVRSPIGAAELEGEPLPAIAAPARS